MKTLILLLALPIFLSAQVTADEISQSEIAVDSVTFEGIGANTNHHITRILKLFPMLEDHIWHYTLTGTIPSKYFLADDYKGTRYCSVCERSEMIHTVLWSERLR